MGSIVRVNACWHMGCWLAVMTPGAHAALVVAFVARVAWWARRCFRSAAAGIACWANFAAQLCSFVLVRTRKARDWQLLCRRAPFSCCAVGALVLVCQAPAACVALVCGVPPFARVACRAGMAHCRAAGRVCPLRALERTAVAAGGAFRARNAFGPPRHDAASCGQVGRCHRGHRTASVRHKLGPAENCVRQARRHVITPAACFVQLPNYSGAQQFPPQVDSRHRPLEVFVGFPSH